MTHEALRERLLDLAYGELAPREAREVEAHAESCEACRAELGRLRETRRTMSALAPEPAPERGERILVAAAREAAESRRPRRARPPWLWSAAAAAFSLVAVAAVSYRLLAMRPGPASDDEALLGRSPYATRPPDAAPAEPAPPAAGEPAEEQEGRDLAFAREERAPAASAPAVPAPAERAERRAKAPAAERFARGEGPSPAAPAPARPAARAESAAPPVADEPAAERRAAKAADEAPAAVAEPRPPPTLDEAPSASAAAAPSRAAGAPPPAAASAPSRAAAAPPDGRAPAPESALRRWAALRDAGGLRAEVRTFEGCAGEAVRRVERDPEGRLVRYVREGRIAGRRLRVEHVYGADGLLAAATVRDLDAPGAVLDADALGLALPARADEAGIDAPPRCGR